MNNNRLTLEEVQGLTKHEVLEKIRKEAFEAERQFKELIYRLYEEGENEKRKLLDEISTKIIEIEEQLKATYPLGYACYKLFENKDVALWFKLREYTRKTLQRYDVYYKDGNLTRGLFSKGFEDLPEDVFMDSVTNFLYNAAKNEEKVTIGDIM